jgi:hypothetical protein
MAPSTHFTYPGWDLLKTALDRPQQPCGRECATKDVGVDWNRGERTHTYMRVCVRGEHDPCATPGRARISSRMGELLWTA